MREKPSVSPILAIVVFLLFIVQNVVAVLINYGQTVSAGRFMLDTTTTGLFPTVAEVSGMAQAHVFQRFRQKAKRNLYHTPFLHALIAVPFIGKKGVYNFITLFFKSFNCSFSCSRLSFS